MKEDRTGAKMLAFYAVILVVFIGIVLVKSRFMEQSTKKNTEEDSVYDKHYALITGKTDEEFWTQVYESAYATAKAENVLVEWFGKDLSAGYTELQLAKMAMDAGVDGIILQAPDEEGTKALIDEIVAERIPVITVLSDCQESTRSSYVGVNNYDIGVLYGEQLKNLIFRNYRKNVQIMIAISGDRITNSQNLILLGIRKALDQVLPTGYYVDLQTQLISQESPYSTEEFFDRLFVVNSLPEIVICLDERGTKCAYRSAVDHNRVGESKIIGYYNSPDILEAVEKQILDSTLSVDAEEIGREAILAMLDCEAHGYTNSYKAVTVELIDQEKAGMILQKAEADENLEGEE